MVYTCVSGAYGAIREGSSPFSDNKKERLFLSFLLYKFGLYIPHGFIIEGSEDFA